MTMQELIDQECNRVMDAICLRRCLRKTDVLSRSVKPYLIAARLEIVQTLFANGFRKADIARTLKRNHSMVKYWLDDETRKRRLRQIGEYAKQRRGNTRDYRMSA